MRVALVGNQNSGKTTLFNKLTGSNQKVGNWPGVTIDRKEGIIKGTKIEIVDLPGIYSLSPYTSEEAISRKYILEEKPDAIINIIDVTSIERSLYLTTQLNELDCPVIVALNMHDMLAKKGMQIDEQKLSEALGVEVLSISALKGSGIEELIKAIENAKKDTSSKIFDNQIEKAIDNITAQLTCDHKRFIAVKMLENDTLIEQTTSVTAQEREQIEKEKGKDIEQVIANARYEYITHIKSKVVIKDKIKLTFSDKLDKVLLNKWAALPIFAVIMFAVYFLSVGLVGSATVDLVDGLVGSFAEWFSTVLEGWGASEWAVSLIADGIIAGVGAVLNFIPQLIILFLCISLLETCGYMSRIAFMLDKIFRKFGLSGKSLIPFIVGSGCSVPAIMACRTIEDEKEKRMTIMVTPFIPCSAKLPIISLFAGYFFGNGSGFVSASLYLLAIAVIIISSIVLNKVFKKSDNTAFISELPEYKLPSVSYTFRDVGEKTLAFIKRAGSIILICSVIVWFLMSFNFKFQYGISVEESILAKLGNCIAWIFYPMLGEWSWAASVSAIQGLVAKEQVVSSMAIIAGLAEDVTEGGLIFGTGSIFGFFNGASAYAFMVFNLFSAPCFGAIGAMRRELGSTKRMWQAVLFQTGLAWILGVITFAIGSIFV